MMFRLDGRLAFMYTLRWKLQFGLSNFLVFMSFLTKRRVLGKKIMASWVPVS